MLLCFLLACGGRFTSVNGSFTSPGYPRNYPNNARCRFEIRVPSDRIIKLTFEEFQLESGYDKVQIMEMRSGSIVRVAELTGSGNSGRTLVSTGNVFIVMFTSDGSVTRKGFVARYHSGRCCSIIFGEQNTTQHSIG